MKIHVPVSLLAALLAATLCAVPNPAASQETGPSEQAAPPDAGADAKLINELLERISRVERELDEYRDKGTRQPADASQRRVIPHLESVQLGTSVYGSEGSRNFVSRLVLVNMTDEPAVLKQENVTLEVDGEAHRLRGVPAEYRNYSMYVAKQSFALRDLAPAKVLNVPAGGTASEWLYFDELPKGNQVPALALKLNFGERTEELDINAFAAQILGLKMERIGPQKCLGLLTISGTINTVNAGTLVEVLDGLAAENVARCVIRWTDTAAPVDYRVGGWLYKAATGTMPPGAPQYKQLPLLPANIRELHLSRMPGYSSSRSAPPSGLKRVHDRDADAVAAALESAYEILPRDELLQEIRFGHPLARSAALANGGGRLASDKLPIILGYADDNNPLMQGAALQALRHFGEAAAVDKLLHYARKGTEPLAETAIESLAASRYADAHEALLKLLENEDPKSKVAIVRILARHPRPIWSETIYRYCQDPRFGLNVEALRALVQVGHPKLMDLLTAALASSDATLRDEAFTQLANRTDPQSEAVAMNYTLKHLKKSLPTEEMYKLLSRTKDRRAIPPLLKQLNTASNRIELLKLLEQIGDQRVADALADNYAKFRPPEQAVALKALLTLGSPRFNEFAAEALLSNESSLVLTACLGLHERGDPEAIRMLSDALENSNNSSSWSYICNTLAQLATPDAQAALRKARDSDNRRKSQYALNALQSLRQRSPGMQYVYEARSFEQQQQWNEALKRYDIAVKTDPELPEAFSGRGNVYLHLNQHKQAGQDFEQALELDPYSSMAVTGLAIVMVLDGKREQAIAKVEQARSKVGGDALFAYNAACVYARALEMLEADKQIEDREQKMQQYREKALSDLKQSVRGGFRDYEWMKNDPDLKSLRGLPDFKRIHSPGEQDEGTSVKTSEGNSGAQFRKAMPAVALRPGHAVRPG